MVDDLFLHFLTAQAFFDSFWCPFVPFAVLSKNVLTAAEAILLQIEAPCDVLRWVLL